MPRHRMFDEKHEDIPAVSTRRNWIQSLHLAQADCVYTRDELETSIGRDLTEDEPLWECVESYLERAWRTESDYRKMYTALKSYISDLNIDDIAASALLLDVAGIEYTICDAVLYTPVAVSLTAADLDDVSPLRRLECPPRKMKSQRVGMSDSMHTDNREWVRILIEDLRTTSSPPSVADKARRQGRLPGTGWVSDEKQPSASLDELSCESHCHLLVID